MAVAVAMAASSSRSTSRGRVEVSVELPIVGKKLVRRHRVLEGRMVWLLPYDVATVWMCTHEAAQSSSESIMRSAYASTVVHAAHVLATCN